MKSARKHVTFRLDAQVVQDTKQYALVHDLQIADVVETALREFLSEEKEQTALEGLLSVCSRTENRIRGLRLDLETLADLNTFFVLHWFCHTSPIPEGLKREAFAQGNSRYQRFLELFREGKQRENILNESKGRN